MLVSPIRGTDWSECAVRAEGRLGGRAGAGAAARSRGGCRPARDRRAIADARRWYIGRLGRVVGNLRDSHVAGAGSAMRPRGVAGLRSVRRGVRPCRARALARVLKLVARGEGRGAGGTRYRRAGRHPRRESSDGHHDDPHGTDGSTTPSRDAAYTATRSTSASSPVGGHACGRRNDAVNRTRVLAPEGVRVEGEVHPLIALLLLDPFRSRTVVYGPRAERNQLVFGPEPVTRNPNNLRRLVRAGLPPAARGFRRTHPFADLFFLVDWIRPPVGVESTLLN